MRSLHVVFYRILDYVILQPPWYPTIHLVRWVDLRSLHVVVFRILEHVIQQPFVEKTGLSPLDLPTMHLIGWADLRVLLWYFLYYSRHVGHS